MLDRDGRFVCCLLFSVWYGLQGYEGLTGRGEGLE